MQFAANIVGAIRWLKSFDSARCPNTPTKRASQTDISLEIARDANARRLLSSTGHESVKSLEGSVGSLTAGRAGGRAAESVKAY